MCLFVEAMAPNGVHWCHLWQFKLWRPYNFIYCFL